MVQLAERPRVEVAAPPPEPTTRHAPPRELLLFLGLAAIGLLLRLHELGNRAYHHDESLHAVYSWYLYIGRGYLHDPLMHGPFQFHVSALIYFLFGDSDVTGRLAAALFGTGIILLPYYLREELGRRGALVAAALFTVSPAFLYFSRFTREDIFLSFFTLGMVVGIFGWIRTRRHGYLWFGSLSLICAFSDKEATYIHVFVFLAFFGLLWATAPLHRLWLPVWSALRDIGPRTWAECIGIFAVIYVLLFTTFLTNIGDPTQWAACYRRGQFSGSPCGGLYSGSVGALAYWLEQHGVQRGGQPFYYYAMLLPLYELVPVVFSIGAVASRWFRHSLFGWFCASWFVGNFAIYSWAGEKMPWLLPHVAMPLVLLAARKLGDWSESFDPRALVQRPALLAMGLGLLAVAGSGAFLAVGAHRTLSPLETQSLALERYTLTLVVLGAIGGLAYLKLVRRVAVGRSLFAAALLVLVAFYVHTSWMVTYAHGDIPVDMLVYVQSSPDVPWVTREIERIGFQTGQRKDVRILMDGGYTENVGGQTVVHESVSWPFEWYLRDYKNRRYYTKTFGPDINLKEYPAILVMGPNLDPIRDQLGEYVGQKYRLNWWYPEDYKNWQSRPSLIWESLTDPVTRAKLLKYLVYRETLNPLGAREFYFFVRKEVPIPGPAPAAPSPRAAAPAAPFVPSGPVVAALEWLSDAAALFGVGQGGEALLAEPKGVAVGADGRIYVAEARAGRISVFNTDGSLALRWGRAGTNDGEFAEPWGIAVSTGGEVFVADTWNHRIQKFSADGTWLLTWGGLVDSRRDPQGAPGLFWGPRDIAIGPDGLVYVSDTGNKRIQVFDPDGTFVRTFGAEGSAPGQFNEPVGLAFLGDALVVADAWNGRIQLLDTSGAPRSSTNVTGWESRAIPNKPYVATDTRGNIYLTAPERNEVMMIDAGGKISGVPLPNDPGGRIGGPSGIEIGADGALLVSQSAGGVVVRLAAVGAQ